MRVLERENRKAPNQHRCFSGWLEELGNTAPPPLPVRRFHIHSKTACRGFKSFCPCQKTGGNSGFLPVFFLHVLHGYSVHFGSDSRFSHPASSASNRCCPLQHPERTRFRLFRPKPGAFRHFCPLLTRKICGSVFVHCADMSHRLKPSVIPCRREVSFLT